MIRNRNFHLLENPPMLKPPLNEDSDNLLSLHPQSPLMVALRAVETMKDCMISPCAPRPSRLQSKEQG
jgi:hypothetical protein